MMTAWQDTCWCTHWSVCT